MTISMTRIVCLLMIVSFCSCKGNEEKTFNTSRNINVECSAIGEGSFLNPWSICHADSVLFVQDYYDNQLITRFFPESGVKTRFAHKGAGPSEFKGPLSLWLFEEMLFIYDRPVFTLSSFDLDEVEGNPDPVGRDHFKVPSTVSQMTTLEDDRFLASGFYPEGRYVILDHQGQIIRTFGSYPEFLPDEASRPYDAKAMFHQVSFSANHEVKKVAAVSDHVLDILDFSDQEVSVARRIQLAPYDYKYKSGNIVMTNLQENFPKGARGVSTTSRYIYLLFKPAVGEEAERTEILVYDWEGNPVRKLFPDRNLQDLAIVGDTLLYGFVADPEPGLVMGRFDSN